MQNQTMIKVEGKTVEVLKALKITRQESYNEVIRRLIDNFIEDHLELNESTKKQILKGMEQMKRGEVLSTKEVLEYFRDKK